MLNNFKNLDSKAISSDDGTNASIDIDAVDVVKLILQYCKENNLNKSLLQIQGETKVKLDSIESVEEMKSDILNGKWDKVLRGINGIDVDVNTLLELYEQVIYELLENDEKNIAMIFMNHVSKDINRLKQEFPQRFKRIQNIIECGISIEDIYAEEKTTKEKNRLNLADKLTRNLSMIAPNRLMMLISCGVKYLKLQKEIPDRINKYHLLSGKIDNFFNRDLNESDSDYVKGLDKQIKMGESSYVESAKFSPDGNYLATGSADGFIDIWDPLTGKLKSDLTYQIENESAVMFHNDSVTTINFSRDSKMLCSGDNSGNIKIFKIANGKCLREFPIAHSKGVTCLAFSKDSSIIISGSFDASLNLFGLKAGKLIKELKGHSSFINDLQIDWETDRFYSASSDGTVIYWDLKNQEMIRKITLPITQMMLDVPINNIIISRQNSTKGEHNLYVSNRSNSIYLMTSEGVVIKSFCTERNKYIVYSTLSNDENWLYVVDEDNCLYTFSVNDSMIKNFFKIHEKDVIALIHHPNLPILASYALDGDVNFYK